MLNVFGGWEIDIDNEQTSLYYQGREDEGCPDCCAYCRNYWHGIEQAPSTLLELFRRLGIDPRRAAHVTWMAKRDSGAQLYTASYLLTGTVSGMPDDCVAVNREGIPCTKYTGLCDGVYFHFNNDICLPGGVKRCPSPVLQLDVFCELPWVIGEAPPVRGF